MTGTLKVDTDALDRLAALIRAAAAEARAAVRDPAPLHASIAALGVPALVQATDAFVQSWLATLAEVVADAHRIADAVALVSAEYREADSLANRAMLR